MRNHTLPSSASLRADNKLGRWRGASVELSSFGVCVCERERECTWRELQSCIEFNVRIRRIKEKRSKGEASES